MSEYKIEAQVKDGDLLVLITDSRDRALRYAALLVANRAYSDVTVQTCGKMYSKEAIGMIP